MNDFETRARAAARAVHAAVDTPAGELTTEPRPHRGPGRALLVAAAVVAIAAIVGTTLVTRDEGAGPTSDVTTFCARIEQMVTTPVDVVNGEAQSREPSLEFLRDAPEEIRPEALALLDARARGREVSADASQRFVRWWQLRCYPDAATPNGGPRNQRYAPMPAPPGYAVCGATNLVGNATLGVRDGSVGTIAIYGNGALADPYDGRMIGIIRTPEQVFYQDDGSAPVTIPGHPDAELIDATGMYGAAIAGLGRAVTWHDDDGVVTVMGRGYTTADDDELTAVAARVASGSDGDEVRDAGRDGLAVLYRGAVAEIYLPQVTSIAHEEFGVTYRTPDVPEGHTAILNGAVPDPAAFEAARFFSPTLRPGRLAGKDVLSGVVPVTNSEEGASVLIARWWDDDMMLTARVGWQQVPAGDGISRFVGATRRLDRAEWEQVVSSSNTCLWSESSSASGSASGSGSSDASSSETSTTTATSPPATLGP